MVAFHSLLWVSGLFSLPQPNLSAKSPSIAAAMADFLKPTKTNARGIPEAPFITKVEDVVKAGDDFQSVMRMFLDRLQQYKFMEQSKRQQLADLKVKIPDIEKNLDVIENIKQQKADENASMEVNYELNDTLYTRAEIDIQKTDSVFLWLGADVMLEYPLDEAVSLLNDRLSNNQQLLKAVEEDLEFLKENITTMEVNTARLFNWDVERRKREKSEAK